MELNDLVTLERGHLSWFRYPTHNIGTYLGRGVQGAVVEGRRIEVNRATPRAKPLPVSQFLSFHQVNHQSQMLQLVKAQTRLAEAQLAVLQMRNAILNPQVKSLIDRLKAL